MSASRILIAALLAILPVHAFAQLRTEASDTSAVPGMSWNNDTNTGMYNAAADIIGFTTGGTERARITSAGISTTGTVRANNFIGDGSGLTGITGTDNLGNHTATTEIVMGTNTIAYNSVVGDKIYLANNKTYGIGLESNVVTTWSPVAFRWRVGATSYNTGSQQMYLNTTGLNVSGSLSVNTDDAVGAPGFTWNGDNNTGMYWVGADQIGLTTGGVQRALINSTGLTVTGGVYVGGKQAIHSSNAYHTAYHTDDTRYGYFAGYTNSGTRGFYLGYGNGGSTVTFALDNATQLSLTGGTLNMNSAKILGVLSPTATTDAANKQYVDMAVTGAADNLGNHTATDTLSMGSNLLAFGNTVADKIRLYSNSYGIGVESSTFTSWTGSAFRWRVGGTSASTGSQQMYLNTTGLVVSGSLSVNTDDAVTAPGHTWNGDNDTGMYWVAANQIGLSTGGVQRALINSSGVRVTGGISTVGGNASIDGTLTANDGVTVGNGSLAINSSRDITSAIAGGQILIQDSTTANSGSKVRIDVNELQAQVDGSSGGYTFNPFGGQVNVGSTGGGGSLFRVNGPTSTCILGSATGNVNCTSDRRLKTDIHPLQGSLEKVIALQGVSFKWKKDPSGTHIGLIAQDVEKQFPQVVSVEEEAGMKTVSYASLVAPLIEAVKEIAHKLSGHDADIAALKAENAELKSRLAAIEAKLANQ